MKKYVDISCDKDAGISITTIDPDTPYWVMKDLLKVPSQVLGAVTGVTLKIYQEDNTENRCVFYWEDNENPRSSPVLYRWKHLLHSDRLLHRVTEYAL